jgi:hypothetical protein
VRDEVPHPYKTTGNIIVLYTLIFVFWIATWKTKGKNQGYCERTVEWCFQPGRISGRPRHVTLLSFSVIRCWNCDVDMILVVCCKL